MQILGVYFVGIRGIVSRQDFSLTRPRISLGWSFTSRICGFLSTGELWFHPQLGWELCAVPDSRAASIYHNVYLSAQLFPQTSLQSLQLCSSSFQVPLPLWVPSGAVYWFAWLSSTQNRPDIQKPLLISCWQTRASFPPQISSMWQFASSTSSLQRLSM